MPTGASTPEQRVVFSHPEAFFAEVASRSPPTYGPELQHPRQRLLQRHQPDQSAQPGRRDRLLRAERLCVLANRLDGSALPRIAAGRRLAGAAVQPVPRYPGRLRHPARL